MKNSSPQHLDLVPSSHRRRRVIFLGLLFLLLLAVGISVIRHPFFPFLFGVSSSQGQSPNAEEENTDTDVMTVAALASEETAIDKFRSGGLGLTRTSWELLHGKPEALGVDSIVYQDSAYKVTYQQDLVWQIEKSWGTTTPALQQARARIRRYLPLDSRLSETIATSDDIFVDVYRSHMLAQLLSPQPAEPPAEKAKRRRKGLPTASCVVVHRLAKQKVTSTLLHIGAPRAEGYFLPQSQTVPSTTTADRSPVRNEVRKEPVLSAKGKGQGRS